MQRYNFSSRVKIKAACPYRTLNIPKDAKYKQAKKQFLIIAMKHHPDTVGDDCEETQKKSQDIFMRCRKALESLEECEDTGKCILKSEAEVKRSMSNEEFDDWFLNVPLQDKMCKILCCPEDVRCQTCDVNNTKTLCGDCEAPVCRECTPA